MYSTSLAGTDVTLGGYNMFRAAGHYATNEPAGRENIANGYLGLGLHVLGTVVEPSAEVRSWLQDILGTTTAGVTTPDRTQNSVLGTFGLRTRLDLGLLTA